VLVLVLVDQKGCDSYDEQSWADGIWGTTCLYLMHPLRWAAEGGPGVDKGALSSAGGATLIEVAQETLRWYYVAPWPKPA
jgi:hypothetical protein